VENILENITKYGTSDDFAKWQNRNVILTNSISLILGIIHGIFAITFVVVNSYESDVLILFAIAFLLISIPYISRKGYINLSRFLFALLAISGPLLFSIYRKHLGYGIIGIDQFYQPRTGLLIFSIIPFVIFEFRERKKILISASIGFLSLMLFDPLHNLFGVGFYQLGNQDPSYSRLNLAFLIFYLFLASVVGFLKKTMEEYEALNESLVDQETERNKIIEKQKRDLERNSYMLKLLLEERDKDLSKVTQELLRINYELLNHSYALSHNLRGPLATLLGLINLIEHAKTDQEREEMVHLALQTALSLDANIHDLNRIVQNQHNSFEIRESFKVQDIFDEILQSLDSVIKKYKVQITSDFREVPVIFSSRARISYIINNLLTNAIQFRKSNEFLKIRVSTLVDEEFIALKVEDTGVGIDMTKYGRDIFKPFKGFHAESSGRGIGLYLVKIQVDKLDGQIDIKSRPGEGTTFTIHIRNFMDIAPQQETSKDHIIKAE